ncbi:FKBP-type peptidyl-prolyl cis-trans isomerase [Serratia marcescens]|nr:FKBP-type peptidyl-prolyl cis-trans isomerase [Serratia marcescens]MBH2766651.1 FKBP-type peptidyl-prolyl cis-trans isomerase [Serratia marcescens]MBH2766711.1 FKBP-type peptidyl-prolyl cis-trans isomerase [Serratia marcescens]
MNNVLIWSCLALMLLSGVTRAAETADQQTLNSLGSILQGDDDAPALLGVVRVQQDAATKARTKKGAGAAGTASLQSRLKAQQAQNVRLSATVASLNAQLRGASASDETASLRQQLDASLAQTRALQKQMDAVRAQRADEAGQLPALTTELQQARKIIDDLRRDAQAKVSALADLKGAQMTAATLQTRLDALSAENRTLKDAAATQKQASDAQAKAQVSALADLKGAQMAATTLQTRLDALSAENRTLKDAAATQKQASDAQTKALTMANEALATAQKAGEPLVPKTATEIRDYAVGTSLAADAVSLFKLRASQGVSIDPTMALAGMRDTFSGQVALSAATLDKALADSEAELMRQMTSQKVANERAGRQYQASFASKPGVKKDADGVLYRIDYQGKGDIAETDVVSVVVKESLTDGSVIKDMEANGKYVSQPLNAFPPLFRTALGRLKNHGSLTLVVPPALAYGDAGDPPRVGPGATMVYNIRIRGLGAE